MLQKSSLAMRTYRFMIALLAAVALTAGFAAGRIYAEATGGPKKATTSSKNGSVENAIAGIMGVKGTPVMWVNKKQVNGADARKIEEHLASKTKGTATASGS